MSDTSVAPLATMAALIREHRMERAIRPLRPVQLNITDEYMKDLFDTAYTARLAEYRAKMAKALNGNSNSSNEEVENFSPQPTTGNNKSSCVGATIDSASPRAALSSLNGNSKSTTAVATTNKQQKLDEGGDEFQDDFHIASEAETASKVPLSIFGKVLALPSEVLNVVAPNTPRVVVSAQRSSSSNNNGSIARKNSSNHNNMNNGNRSVSLSHSSVGRSASQTPPHQQQSLPRQHAQEQAQHQEPEEEAAEQRTPSVASFVASVFAPVSNNNSSQHATPTSRRSSVVAVHVPSVAALPVEPEVEQQDEAPVVADNNGNEEAGQQEEEEIVISEMEVAAVLLDDEDEQVKEHHVAGDDNDLDSIIESHLHRNDDGAVKQQQVQHLNFEHPPLHPVLTASATARANSANKAGASSSRSSSIPFNFNNNNNNSRTVSPTPSAPFAAVLNRDSSANSNSLPFEHCDHDGRSASQFSDAASVIVFQMSGRPGTKQHSPEPVEM